MGERRAEMKFLVMVFVAAIFTGCAPLGIVDPGTQQRAARNLCEAMRSYRPYYPNQCGELSSASSYGYGPQWPGTAFGNANGL